MNNFPMCYQDIKVPVDKQEALDAIMKSLVQTGASFNVSIVNDRSDNTGEDYFHIKLSGDY